MACRFRFCVGACVSYFVLWAQDRPNSLELRQKLRPEHRARLRQHDHPVVCRSGGPWLNDAGEMAGSVLVIEAASIDAVEAYVAEDPYVQNDLYQSIEIRPFVWGLGQPEDS